MRANPLLCLPRRQKSFPVKILVRKQKFLETEILIILLDGYELYLASW